MSLVRGLRHIAAGEDNYEIMDEKWWKSFEI